MILRLAATIACLVPAKVAWAALTAITHVTLIDGSGGPPRPDATVIVAGNRIQSVDAGSIPPSALVIDGRGKFLIPGLMDIHIHLKRPDRQAAEQALAGYLYLGFTTVADLGNHPETILPLRADERAGRLPAPRIFAVGNVLTSPGGKSEEIGIAISDFERDKTLLDRHIGQQAPDFVKLVYDEGGWGPQPPLPLLPRPLLADLIRYYHRHGLRSVVHAISEQHSIEALDAGADALAHAVFLEPIDDAFVKLMATKKVPFATTLTIGDNYSRLVEHPEFLDRGDYAAAFSRTERDQLRTVEAKKFAGQRITAWRKRMLPVAQENIRRIVRAGGVAALGTDQASGPAAHREMQLLVAAGLSPLEVLTAATSNAAVFLGQSDQLGAIAPGKLADLVLLNADPTEDIENVEDIAWVMKDGIIVDESKLPLAGGSRPRRSAPR